MRWLILLALVTGLGCDSSALVANIDTYTCAWLPSVAVDCNDSDVHDRALSVLHNGFVQGRFHCPMYLRDNNVPTALCRAVTGSWDVTLFADGSLYAYDGGYTGPARFVSRAETYASSPGGSADLSNGFPYPPAINTWSLAAGEITYTASDCPNITTVVETECTGFNLEAFGDL